MATKKKTDLSAALTGLILGAVTLFELGDLRGERAHDVALRRRLVELWVRLRVGGRPALLLGAKLLDAGPQR